MSTLLIASFLLTFDEAPKKPLSARPTVLVLKVKGVVTVEGRLGKHRVEAGDYLLPGETVSAAADAEALLVFLVKGERRRLKPGGRLTLTATAATLLTPPRSSAPPNCRARTSPRSARSRSVRAAALVWVRGGRPTTEARIAPLYGSFITTGRPTLTWPSLDKAESYLVNFSDGGRSWKVSTKATRLDYPAKEKPLAPGQKYVWSVKALLPGGDEKAVVEESKFVVLSEDERRELEAVRKLAASDDPADLLLAAATYEGYGVLYEALAVFEKLARLQPKVARWQLALARYYRHAGRPDQAKEARAGEEAGRCHQGLTAADLSPAQTASMSPLTCSGGPLSAG